MQKKKAISLIVLVITIIVMIVLAGAIILSLNNAGIINRANEAVAGSNLATAKTVAELAWSEAYNDGVRTVEDNGDKKGFQKRVEEALINAGLNIADYKITATTNGVEVNIRTIPLDWEENIVAIVDGVPIPKGFVASSATGENKKDEGLVIYEGTVAVTDKNVYNARRDRNQYVWVPVDDFSKFVRGSYNNSTYSNLLGEGYWEVVLDTTTNMPDVESNLSGSAYMTVETPEDGITNTLAEVQAMYASVKEYGGFYIARYEAGLDIEDRRISGSIDLTTTVYSRMNKAPYNNIGWNGYSPGDSRDTGGVVEVARGMYPETNENVGVVSTLTYGVQWDRTLAWWIETSAQNGTKAVTIQSAADLEDSINYGNYKDASIQNETFNQGAFAGENFASDYFPIDSSFSKEASQKYILTTGATEQTKVNNIYDMAGNVAEYTMEGKDEGYFGYSHIVRGKDFELSGANVTYRDSGYVNYKYYSRGFRLALYIKK